VASPSPYWFRAKRYGFGWGLPSTWQGSVVFVVWLAAFIEGSMLLHQRAMAHLAFAVLMISLLVGICYLKGEPPRWRWGRCGA
jgi:hypothetical protein